MREWKVAGGLLADERGLLLVANRRRNGTIDWTTPGGVVDPGETSLEALSREVSEETGLRVTRWGSLCWTVDVTFVDLEMHMSVEVHRATSFEGDFVFEDPDGIVGAAEFLQGSDVVARLSASPRWVSEPLAEWIEQEWSLVQHFEYRALGAAGSLRAERLPARS